MNVDLGKCFWKTLEKQKLVSVQKISSWMKNLIGKLNSALPANCGSPVKNESVGVSCFKFSPSHHLHVSMLHLKNMLDEDQVGLLGVSTERINRVSWWLDRWSTQPW